jgi:uncharacterized membrane protein YeaQ/YmgE (transglycosylase-associated protein family)
MGLLWTIIVTIVVGLIIGFLGKAVAPGDRDNIPLWLTIVCGIVGAFVGSYLYYALFGVADNYPKGDMYDTSRGLDWWRPGLVASPVAGPHRGRAGRDRVHRHRAQHQQDRQGLTASVRPRAPARPSGPRAAR